MPLPDGDGADLAVDLDRPWDLPEVAVTASDDAGAAEDAPPLESRAAVLQELARWARAQAFPEASDGELVKFLHSCDYDLEKAKKCVKGFHACRKGMPELFSGWDTDLPHMQSILDVIRIVIVPRRTPQNYRVLVNSLQTPDTANYVFADVCKALLMVLETIFLTEPTVDGVVVVHDMGQASFGHFMKFGWSLPKKLTTYMQDGLPLKRQTVHLVNCSSFVDKGLRMMSHIGRKDDWDRLRVHSGSDYTALHQDIPPDCLPSDLGGTLPSIAELHETTVRRLASFNEIFRKQCP